MKIRIFTLLAVVMMLVSLFTVTAMAADQDRDRDEGCTGVPEHATRGQYRAGINADTSLKGVTGNGNGVCDGSNCPYDGDCDGDMDRLQKRDGSCLN